MRLLLLIALFVSTSLAADIEIDSLFGSQDSPNYPADGAVSVTVDVTIWFVGIHLDETCEGGYRLDSSKVRLAFAGVEAINNELYESPFYDPDLYDVDIDCDTLFFKRIRPLISYHEYNVAWVWVYSSLDTPSVGGEFRDTITFRTESDTLPFAISPSHWSFADSTPTGSQYLTIWRCPGTTVYGIDPDGDVFTVYEPSEVYATESRKRRISYQLTDIPDGGSTYGFLLSTPEGLQTADTHKVHFVYHQSIHGRPHGVISR